MLEPTVVVGKVTKAHGVRGEVAVLVLSEIPDRFAAGASLLLDGERTLTISATRGHGGRLLVKFEGVEDRAAADLLRGRMLSVPQSWLPQLPPGRFWPHELEGCEVVTESGRSLGTVTEVVANPANDLWVATAEDGTETMIPAIREVVVGVDPSAGRVLVRDLPGLTIPEDLGEPG